MIKLKNILKEGIKKSEMDALGKKINEATKLINKADDMLYSAWNDVRKLEDKAGDDYNDPKSVERAIYNLKDSISLGMRHMLKDPLKKADMIKDQIKSILRKL